MNMTEEEKMKAGMIYDPNESGLVMKRERAHILSRQYNATDEHMAEERRRILSFLVGILPPRFLDRSILTMAAIPDLERTSLPTSISRSLIAPRSRSAMMSLSARMSPSIPPMHPFLPSERNCYVRKDGVLTDQEYAKPIVIEKNCWIAGSVVICGGVTIGEGSIIGAGSVVTRSIPPHSLACGNPCRVIRTLDETKDAIKDRKDLFE